MGVVSSQLSTANPGRSTPGLQPKPFLISFTGLSPSMAGRSRPLQLLKRGRGRAHDTTSPHSFLCGFGLSFSLFARCYWGNTIWFLFLSLLGCFRSGSSRSLSERRRYHPRREVPFGYLRIEACMRLPGAYRSLPRPSSVPKPSHPSGGVSCRTYFGTHTRLTFEAYAWCHRDPQPLIDHLPFAS